MYSLRFQSIDSEKDATSVPLSGESPVPHLTLSLSLSLSLSLFLSLSLSLSSSFVAFFLLLILHKHIFIENQL